MKLFCRIFITIVASFIAICFIVLTKLSEMFGAWGPSKTSSFAQYYPVIIFFAIAIVPWFVRSKKDNKNYDFEKTSKTLDFGDNFYSKCLLNTVNLLASPIFIAVAIGLINFDNHTLFNSTQLFLSGLYVTVLFFWFSYYSNIIFDTSSKSKALFPYFTIFVIFIISLTWHGVSSIIEMKKTEVFIKTEIDKNKASFNELRILVPELRKYFQERKYFLMSDFKSKFSSTFIESYYKDPNKYQQSLWIDSTADELTLNEFWDVCNSKISVNKNWCQDHKFDDLQIEQYDKLKIALTFADSTVYFKGDKLYINKPVIVIGSSTGTIYFHLNDDSSVMCYEPFHSSTFSDIHHSFLTNYMLKNKYAGIPCDR